VRVKNDLEERGSDAASAEEQAKRLSGELSSLQDQLRREKDRVTQVDKQRSGLDAQLRELQVVLLTYCTVLRSTQPPTPSGKEKDY